MLMLSGCGYSVQKRSNLPFGEVYIGKINNNIFEPKLQDKLYRMIVETLVEYGFEITPASRYRLEADIKKFDIKTISEKDLITTEYLLLLSCDFRLIDTHTNKVLRIEGISDPFTKYFIAKGKLENILAQKEIVTESSMKDISRELIRYLIRESSSRK